MDLLGLILKLTRRGVSDQPNLLTAICLANFDVDEDAEIENPEGVRRDIGHDFIQATMDGGSGKTKGTSDGCSPS